MKHFDPFTIGLTALMPLSLLIASIISYPLCIWLLKRYHAAVSRSMAKSINEDSAENSFGKDQSISSEKKFIESAGLNNESSGAFYQSLHHRPRLAALVHLGAGAIFAPLMVAITLISMKEGFSPIRFLILFMIYLWPVVITISIIAASTRKHKFFIFGAYLVCFLITGFILIGKSPNSSWGGLIYLWGSNNLVATLFFLIFLRRKVRAVGPMIFTFLTVAVFGVLLLPSLIGSIPTLLKAMFNVFYDLGFNAGGFMMALHVMGFILFAVLGWIALNIIKTRYKNKKISDQSITLDAIWIVFGAIYSMSLIFSGAYWVPVGLLAIVAYKVIVKIADKQLSNTSGSGESSSLLFLRVFSLGNRTKDLFNHVSNYWRYTGSIHLISGPDLATTTIEPHEFLDYLTGKLSRRFINNNDQLAIRLSEMDNKPDRDGRYRVNDFFCYNDTWKVVLLNLVNRSKVVLMDIRNFCTENKGCEYEINELINIISLQKIVFVTDKTTDQEFLKSTFHRSFKEMRGDSPNKAYNYKDVCVFNFDSTSSAKFNDLLRTLSKSAINGNRTPSIESLRQG